LCVQKIVSGNAKDNEIPGSLSAAMVEIRFTKFGWRMIEVSDLACLPVLLHKDVEFTVNTEILRRLFLKKFTIC
jgi:hypothetical protein